MKYAASTNVSSEKSKSEIEIILRRYGADQFLSGWRDGQAMIGFRMSNKMIRFLVPLPSVSDKGIALNGWGHKRRQDQIEKAFDQACRQRWRALALVVKAKLEAVECGIATFEEEFMAHIVLPGTNRTLGEEMLPRIDRAYKTGVLPSLEWGGGSGKGV